MCKYVMMFNFTILYLLCLFINFTDDLIVNKTYCLNKTSSQNKDIILSYHVTQLSV